MAPSSTARIPTRTNLLLAGTFILAHAVILILLPAAGIGAFGLAVAAGVLALCSPAHWALVHEAIHGMLLPVRAANDRLARVLAITFGAPFRAVRFAHLRHHRYNRTPWGREEVYDPATRSTVTAYAQHYFRISFGLYIGELALNFLCWMPREWLRPRLHAFVPDPNDGASGMASVADRDVLGAGLWQIRVDAICVIALYGAAFVLYGAHWPVLVAFLSVRGFISSQMDHAPHHDTPIDQRDYALNMSAPRWLNAFLLNFNLHRAHHQQPNAPWPVLAELAKFEAGDISFVRAVARQWRGPIALPRLVSGETQ